MRNTGLRKKARKTLPTVGLRELCCSRRSGTDRFPFLLGNTAAITTRMPSLAVVYAAPNSKQNALTASWPQISPVVEVMHENGGGTVDNVSFPEHLGRYSTKNRMTDSDTVDKYSLNGSDKILMMMTVPWPGNPITLLGIHPMVCSIGPP